MKRCKKIDETDLFLEGLSNALVEFSKEVFQSIEEWASQAAKCDGNTECLEKCGRELRKSLDAAFPDSKKVEFETDKVNYMLSSVFFLVNRMSKAGIGLAEFDMAIKKMEGRSIETPKTKKSTTELHDQLDQILGKYF